MRALPLLLLSLLLLVPLSAEASSLRCGSKLVSEGSSRAETLLKCGEPLSRDVRTVIERTKVKSGGAAYEVSQETAVVRTIEEWVFNFGRSNFMQKVTFVDGKLRKVESGDYGF